MIWLEDESGLFPHPLSVEDEVIALTNGLSTKRLFSAYSHGIFPWYSEGQPVLWWFPKVRAVLYPDKLKIHKSMRSILLHPPFHISFNRNFEGVIQACSRIPRKDQDGTWITAEMVKSYIELHQQGWAHSVEVWQDDRLVGGLYGVLVGRVFYGESMFSTVSNASKFALIHLVQHLVPKGLQLIDVQQDTAHLRSMGAEVIPGETFYNLMRLNQKWYLSHGHIPIISTTVQKQT